MRTLEWDNATQRLKMVDQRLLPSTFSYIFLDSYQAVSDSIRDMAVRGAPAIGVAAAFGMVLAAYQSKATTFNLIINDLEHAAQILKNSRPTAVNLPWALKRMLEAAKSHPEDSGNIFDVLLDEALKMAEEDVEANKALSTYGAELIEDGDTIIHHCNTGALAAVDWGTALGVIRMAHEQGKKIHVLVDETRPRLQGARLTAWELSQYKIPYDIITDNSAGSFLHSGKVNKVIFGADRVASNGDVANKIGTYMLALAAHANNVPVYCAFPFSTVDFELASGDLIQIEERAQDEVLDLKLKDLQVAPNEASARNLAFDVTPNELITAFITENGVIYPPFKKNLIGKMQGK
jgi:methylthioribose-1-phosphate isomerase